MAKNVVTLNLDNTDYSFRPYGTCSTSDSISAKTVNISEFTLCTGATILIKFTQSNKANNITLNVNGTGAIPVQGLNDIFYQGVYYEFLYDGTNWVEVGERHNHRCSSYTANNNNYPYRRIASTNIVSTTNINQSTTLILKDPSVGGKYGELCINYYTATEGKTASYEIYWIINKGFNTDHIKIGFINTPGAVCMDVFYKNPSAWAALIVEQKMGGKKEGASHFNVNNGEFKFINSYEVSNTTATDKLTSYECYKTIEDAATELYGKAYSIITAPNNGTNTPGKISFNGDLTGNAATATTSGDSNKLGGQLPSYYATAADYVKKSGDTMTGDLTIKRNSSDSPSIILQRGETNDTFEDWRMSNVGGHFKIQNRNSGNTWVDVLSLAPSATKTLTSSYSVLPSANDTLTLGNSTYKWKEVYATTFNGNATSATTTTHLAGGAAGSIPYQTAAGTTTMLAKGNNGQVLKISNGVPTWANEYTCTHPDSGVTANSYGPSTNATPAHGETFSVPYFTVNAQGHVTAASTKTITLPADNNTDTKNTAGATNSASKMYLIGATTQGDNPQTYSNSNVYATNGDLVANSFQGSIKGTSADNVNTAYKDLHFRFYNNVSGCDSTVSTDGKRYAGTVNSFGFPVSNNANSMLWLGAHSGNYGHQLGFSSDGRIYDRYISNGSFPTTVNGGSWKKIAYTSDIITPEIATETEIKNASWW